MSFWKILPIVAVVFLIVLGFVVYLSEPEAKTNEEIAGIVRSGDSNFDYYEKYVRFKENPKLKMTRNFAGKRMILLSGVIENRGDRVLDVVEIKLVLFNADVPVHETTRLPVQPDKRHTPPVQPLEERSFTLYVENIPENWNAGNAEAMINGFRFYKVTPNPF